MDKKSKSGIIELLDNLSKGRAVSNMAALFMQSNKIKPNLWTNCPEVERRMYGLFSRKAICSTIMVELSHQIRTKERRSLSDGYK